MLDIPAEDLAAGARLDLADSALHAPATEFGRIEYCPLRRSYITSGRLQGVPLRVMQRGARHATADTIVG